MALALVSWRIVGTFLQPPCVYCESTGRRKLLEVFIAKLLWFSWVSGERGVVAMALGVLGQARHNKSWQNVVASYTLYTLNPKTPKKSTLC